MKRLLFFLVLATALPVSLISQEQMVARDTNLLKINSFINQIIDQTTPVPDSLNAISDYLIEMSKDSLMKRYVARLLFEKFYNSPVMGMESSAIYLAQKYFLSGRLKAFSESQLADLNLYVEFNKNTLLGMKAPPLRMESSKGDSISLGDILGEYTLIYFYDDECSVCRAEAPKMKKVLREIEDTEISVFAVYVEQSRDRWLADISKNFPADSLGNHKWYFVRDPEFTSDYQRLYGVTGTPKLFLLDRSGTIVGRGLNTESLSDLLNTLINGDIQQRARLMMFIHNYLNGVNFDNPESIDSAFSALYERSKGEKELFRALFNELYLYLKYSADAKMQRASIKMAKDYIVNKPQLWDSTFVAKTEKSIRLAQINQVGERATDLTLRSLTGKKMRLSKIKSEKSILIFFDIACPICAEELKQFSDRYDYYIKKGVTPIAVYTGSNTKALISFVKEKNLRIGIYYDRDGDAAIYDKYDISSVPAIYLLGRDKTIEAKDINHKTLDNLLK